MKTFKDLEFKKHSVQPMFDKQAEITFDNNYGVSVICGQSAYTRDSEPYELAVLYKGSLTYNTHITDDVVGYQTEEGVSALMKMVQELED